MPGQERQPRDQTASEFVPRGQSASQKPPQTGLGICSEVPRAASHGSHRRSGVLGGGSARRHRIRAGISSEGLLREIRQKWLTPWDHAGSPRTGASAQGPSPGPCQARSLLSSLGWSQQPGKVPARFRKFRLAPEPPSAPEPGCVRSPVRREQPSRFSHPLSKAAANELSSPFSLKIPNK